MADRNKVLGLFGNEYLPDYMNMYACNYIFLNEHRLNYKLINKRKNRNLLKKM